MSYRSPDLFAALKDACPKGIDVYFDNVGGDVLKAVLGLVNPFARIPALRDHLAVQRDRDAGRARTWARCSSTASRSVASSCPITWIACPRSSPTCGGWVREGRLKYREDVVEGLDQAPRAFIGLLRGENLGKMLVKVGPDPSR